LTHDTTLSTLKKVRTPSQIQATAAARKRGLFVAGIAFVVGVVMLLLSNYFLQLHCVMAAAVALAGGIAAARAAMPIDRESARSAGVIGGVYATVAYALPFMVFNFVQFNAVTTQTVGQRISQLAPEQIAQIEQNNIQLGVDFFKGQDIAYLFGYLLFALMFGAVFGLAGAVLVKRQMA